MATQYKFEIISYERSDEDELTPILKHTFYGNTPDEALETAKSHLISDYFFSSTFVGSMKWGDGELSLDYDGKILKLTPKESHKILGKLKKEAQVVNNKQIESGIDEFITNVMSYSHE